MTQKKTGHVPVLLNESMNVLMPIDGKTYIDATFGDGGYSENILMLANCNVIAIDQDPDVFDKAKYLMEKYGNRFKFYHRKFSEISELLLSLKIKQVDGFVFDIGVSSMQIDNDARGFSFQKNGKLDMRMSQEGPTVEDIINNIEQDELADILFQYGDETKSRKIAKKIIDARKVKKILTTLELAEIVSSCFPNKYYKKHPATQTFQALRIYLNNEVQQLISGLNIASKFLSKGGKLCLITFHSIEDRIVKNFFKIAGSKNYVPNSDENKILYQSNRKAIKPSNEEIEINRRSRSAKLRYGVRNNNEHTEITINQLGYY